MTGKTEHGPRALVAYASRHGATVGVAEAVAAGLRSALPAGAEVAVLPCAAVDDLHGFDGVVLGSAVYFGHWLEEARDLVLRCAIDLWDRPVWLFSTGPLGVPGRPPEALIDVDEIQQLSRALEHRVFPGRLDRSRLDFPERALTTALHAPEGDFRPWDDIRTWGAAVGQALFAAVGDGTAASA